MKRKYIIIGGTSGIGEEMVRRLASMGSYVIFFGRNKEAGEQIVREIGSDSGEYNYLDISSDDAIEILKNCLNDNKSYEACINFAGVMYLSKLLDYEVSDWIDMAKINYIGLLSAIAAIIPKLNKGSLFINVSSVAALNPSVGNAAYAASKIAADTIMNALRKECVSSGIKVGTIHLGGVDTEINSKIRNQHMRRTISLRTKTYTPMCKEQLVNVILKLMDVPSGINIGNIFITPTDQPD